jgi:hypothetical protein
MSDKNVKLVLDNSQNFEISRDQTKIILGDNGKVELYQGSKLIYPAFTAAVNNNEKAQSLYLPNLKIGDAVDFDGNKIENYNFKKHFNICSGIYFGVEERVNKKTGLKEIWDLYAAPQDLKNADGSNLLLTYNGAVNHVAGLKNLHGHDGGHFANDAAVYAAMDAGTYNGEWFIPSKEILHGKDAQGNILHGKDAQGNKVQKDNLYDYREKGALKGTFVTTNNGPDNAQWYWSDTEHPVNSSFVYTVDFTDGNDDWDYKGNFKLSTRLVRAELRLAVAA